MANVFELLDREWARLRRNRSAVHELADVCRLADGSTSLGDVERYVRAASPEDADRILLALVTHAVAGGAVGALAARVLLQLLLPGTRGLARRWWALGDQDERAAAAVTAVYHRICAYPLARRPGRVAANILMDAARELRRAIPPAALAPLPHPAVHRSDHDDIGLHPALELAEVLVDAVNDHILAADDAQLIARSRIAGHRVADIADHLGFRPRTLWDRRQRAEHTLITALAVQSG